MFIFSPFCVFSVFFFVYLHKLINQIYIIMTTTTAKNSEVKKVTSKETPNSAKTVKKEISKSTINEVLNPTAEARIGKLKALNKLSEKYERLTKMKEDLDVFKASLDLTNQSIVLTNSMDEEFFVSNPVTFERVLNVVIEDLNSFTNDAKNEVLKFQI